MASVAMDDVADYRSEDSKFSPWLVQNVFSISLKLKHNFGSLMNMMWLG